MSEEPVRQQTAEQRTSDDLPKNYQLTFLQDNGAHSFVNEHRLLGNIKNVAKTAEKKSSLSTSQRAVQQRSTLLYQINTKEIVTG
ncbi:peptidyl-prolyl cis-trans isomerase FKBP3-like [Stigmatopora argus]